MVTVGVRVRARVMVRVNEEMGPKVLSLSYPMYFWPIFSLHPNPNPNPNHNPNHNHNHNPNPNPDPKPKS